MKALLPLTAALLLSACTKQPPPETPAQIAFDKFVEAGCTTADDSGAGAAALLEESLSDAAPSWAACLEEGGSVASCGLSCSADQ